MIWRTSMDKHQVHPLSLLPPKSWSNKAGIMWFWEIRWHQSSGRGWFRFRSTFWGLLTFVVSWYAWHDISILLWCYHHPPQLIILQVSFTSFLVHLTLGLFASSLVTLQSQLMCCLCKPFPPQKPHILLACVALYHLGSYPLESRHASSQTNAMHPEIIILVRIFECRIQKLRAFVVTTISGDAGKDYHYLTCDLIEPTFWDHSSQDQVVETPASKSQMIDNALVSDLV